MIYGHTYDGEKSKGYNEFKFKRLSDKSVQKALEIVHLSDQIIDIQRKYVGAYFIKMFILINIPSYVLLNLLLFIVNCTTIMVFYSSKRDNKNI